MDQAQSRTIRYAVAGVCVLALLMLFGWLVLREPAPSSEPPPVRVVTVTPRTRSVDLLFTADDETPRETLTNQVAGSATTNAATIYWQAFGIFDTLSQTQKDLVANWRTNVDASVEAELCEKVQPICDLMHQAAAVSNCDWGLEQPITFATKLPHLSRCRNLARAAAWSVAHCRTGDPSAAVDDLVAASRLGQTVTSPPILIGHLVDLAIQGIVIDSVTEHASQLVSVGGMSVGELLNNANYDEGWRRAFEVEADIAAREVDRLAALPPEEATHELTQLANDTNNAISTISTVLVRDLTQRIVPVLPIDIVNVQRLSQGQLQQERETQIPSQLPSDNVTRLEVGKRITNRIQVGYVHIFGANQDENANEALIKYRLTAHWSLQSQYGDAGVGGLDLMWSRRY